MARRVSLFAVAVATLSLGACQARAKSEPNIAMLRIARDAARFAITTSTDTTVIFRPEEVRWIRPGMRGNVLDPLQRDAFIARITVQHVDTAGTIALIAGGVSPVKSTHIVVFEKPTVSWWRDIRFWRGAAGGAVVGLLAASASK